MSKDFEIKEAVREAMPVIIGIVGPTGSGKTASALEIATGLQDAQGGEIGILETDGKRSLALAGSNMFSDPARFFKFKRAALADNFSPLRYKAGIEYMVSQGVKHIIIDSASHMHEGIGGTLDLHAKEQQRIADAWKVSFDKATFPAWVKPKGELAQFTQYFKSLDVNLIFCFRAKEKIKIIGGKPVDAGWLPIANEELFFEMDLACLLLPNSDGQPIWDHAEHKPIKALPHQFRALFKGNPRLSIELGRKIATWAKGPVLAPTAPVKAPEAVRPPAAPEPTKTVAAPYQAPNPKVPESITQRTVKAMARINSANSTDDLKVLWNRLCAEAPELKAPLDDSFDAKMGELAEAGL